MTESDSSQRLVGRVDVRRERVQGLGVNLKRRELPDVVLQDGEQLRVDRGGLVPVLLVPLLKVDDLRALEPHVELDVLRQARAREVG